MGVAACSFVSVILFRGQARGREVGVTSEARLILEDRRGSACGYPSGAAIDESPKKVRTYWHIAPGYSLLKPALKTQRKTCEPVGRPHTRDGKARWPEKAAHDAICTDDSNHRR